MHYLPGTTLLCELPATLPLPDFMLCWTLRTTRAALRHLSSSYALGLGTATRVTLFIAYRIHASLASAVCWRLSRRCCIFLFVTPSLTYAFLSCCRCKHRAVSSSFAGAVLLVDVAWARLPRRTRWRDVTPGAGEERGRAARAACVRVSRREALPRAWHYSADVVTSPPFNSLLS